MGRRCGTSCHRSQLCVGGLIALNDRPGWPLSHRLRLRGSQDWLRPESAPTGADRRRVRSTSLNSSRRAPIGPSARGPRGPDLNHYTVRPLADDGLLEVPSALMRRSITSRAIHRDLIAVLRPARLGSPPVAVGSNSIGRVPAPPADSGRGYAHRLLHRTGFAEESCGAPGATFAIGDPGCAQFAAAAGLHA